MRHFFPWTPAVATLPFGMPVPTPPTGLVASENLPRRFAYEWASLCRSPTEWRRRIPQVEEFASIRCPVTAVGIEDDDIGTRQALARLHESVPSEFLKSAWIRPADFGLSTIGHWGVFRSSRETVWTKLHELLLE
jgi:predicted alpha/beta hydrolase